MTTEQTGENHVIWSKAPEKILTDLVVSLFAWRLFPRSKMLLTCIMFVLSTPFILWQNSHLYVCICNFPKSQKVWWLLCVTELSYRDVVWIYILFSVLFLISVRLPDQLKRSLWEGFTVTSVCSSIVNMTKKTCLFTVFSGGAFRKDLCWASQFSGSLSLFMNNRRRRLRRSSRSPLSQMATREVPYLTTLKNFQQQNTLRKLVSRLGTFLL